MNNWLKDIPIDIRKFIIKAFIIFLVWKIAYHSILQPLRIIDKPLTDFTTFKTIQLYNYLNKHDSLYYVQNIQSTRGTIILKNNKKVIGVDDGCNALELMVIYIAFILCIPNNKFKKQLSYITGGTLLIFLLNILRCYLLIYIHFEYPQVMDIAHHYFFNITVYAVIFFLWVRYLKKHN